MTRAAGVLLLVGALAVCVVVVGLLAAGVSAGRLEVTGAVLGFGLALLVAIAPLAGGGVLVLTKSKKDAVTDAEAQQLRKILDVVKAKGQVSISDVIIELGTDLPTVRSQIYSLVGMGLYSGYINWDDGTLYSAEAAALHETTQCKHCGGTVSLAGKGVLKCAFCGTEYFIGE